ncbi:hypothetical protein QBC33DRAFT_450811 [Phialemonium atrogriseum]|uniref:Zinc finger Mcm10/DnaG-type domain-containing protein n=1 Tax=Phialemonium atrogriseum TaxID=1093897 RepID=A0AAJ0C203_9PEZI|nr:uncharacterized protein QBC33DRAFT_450811 [Phialemonium atrogriseum]KAK1767643.1 hypothetical protein QBC33DRAFT_450811 [Phialemonium atrogriseum]
MASQWPPRSPHEALLGTPGGRDRVRRAYDGSSPSPSPSKSKTSRPTSMLASRPVNGARGGDPEDELQDDDDEETLQLKLQAIEARLRLKKLQTAKSQRNPAAGLATECHRAGPESAPASAAGLREVPLQSRLAAARERMDREISQKQAQVPASPVKKAQSTADLQTSPKRILLGIDKGRRAADVSLKRAPSIRKLQENGQQGGYLRRSKTPNPDAAQQFPASRPVSFNERLASARSEEVSRQERQERIQKLRSTAFNVGQEEMEQYKSAAINLPDIAARPEQFSREEILASANRQNGGLQRSNTAPSIRSTSRVGLSDAEGPPPASAARVTKKKVPPAEVADRDASAFEPYSGLHLSKRVLPHKVLTRAVSGKKTYLIKDLLRHVKSPDWSLPDIEQDVVVMAIVASKSDPRHHRPAASAGGAQQQDRGKYMVITLVDLTYEVDLFLFNTGFDRFWKLTTGTVVAVLNPTILPPPAGREATGRFSLVINSDADTILEIGNARDLGYCKSVKRDGKLCHCWVNSKRTEYCEFHTNEAVRKVRNSRVELNGMDFGGGGGSTRYKANSYRVQPPKTDAQLKKEQEERKRGTYDRETQSRWFVSGASRSAGDDEREGGLADRVERGEALKRRLAQKERERDIAKRLGEIGGGAGKEADARALGLVAPRGGQPKVDLGRAKRKRPESSQSSSTANGGSLGGRAALGWGSVLGKKLTRMKEGEKLDGTKASSAISLGNSGPARGPGGGLDESPVRKKTRFVTEKGIREAGRESLGEPLSATSRGRQVVLDDDDDDDDDLIIVK